MSVKDDLIAAKALIDTQEKWRQDGRYGLLSGSLCAEGACMTATRSYNQLVDFLYDALPGKNRWKSVAEYNDDRRTTHADIMALFDRAIAAQETTS